MTRITQPNVAIILATKCSSHLNAHYSHPSGAINQQIGLSDAFLIFYFVGWVIANQDSYGYGDSVFDSGEGALKIATISKDSSRRENYSLLIPKRSSDEI